MEKLGRTVLLGYTGMMWNLFKKKPLSLLCFIACDLYLQSFLDRDMLYIQDARWDD
jgi:hypothetical protein